MLPLATVLVFKGTSLVLGLVGLLLAARRLWIPASIMLAAAAPCLLASLLVSDLSRSLGYLFPLLLLCTRTLNESLGIRDMQRISLCAAAAGVLVPTSFIWESTLVTYTPAPMLVLEHLLSIWR